MVYMHTTSTTEFPSLDTLARDAVAGDVLAAFTLSSADDGVQTVTVVNTGQGQTEVRVNGETAWLNENDRAVFTDAASAMACALRTTGWDNVGPLLVHAGCASA